MILAGPIDCAPRKGALPTSKPPTPGAYFSATDFLLRLCAIRQTPHARGIEFAVPADWHPRSRRRPCLRARPTGGGGAHNLAREHSFLTIELSGFGPLD